MRGVQRTRRGRKARHTYMNSEHDITCIGNELFTLIAVATEVESNSGRRSRWPGRRRKRVAFVDLTTAVHKRFRNNSIQKVDRIVGSVYENGKLYYRVKWENTLESAKNLRECANTAIAEYRFPYLLLNVQVYLYICPFLFAVFSPVLLKGDYCLKLTLRPLRISIRNKWYLTHFPKRRETREM